MDTLSIADVFWSALVLCGVIAELLERRARRSPRAAGSAVPALVTSPDRSATPARV